ncbi:hypothetical protein CHU32_24645 [Superficieibacter electus]|uniref:Uncharacterized protein n=1 Tax=Superficieibacter electus TaxID=2022662 RepID=A0A2P5GI46_9ENTR|nr:MULTISPECIES: hypothetical protein [Superficieibacter]POP41755.1 hypothetical protein CHU33_21860 [Superficieibacter electus]POP42567.1 hypothetical protein CHU32_24645 [Superficieibacter electus]WES69145.1 hypothetical protein P0H77_03790 [Superficieibacter sp. HKU1]
MQQPYLFNPGMNTEELEQWLSQQRLHVACYNNLLKEKAALEERLNEVNDSIEKLSSLGFEGELSFPCSPSPSPANAQK